MKQELEQVKAKLERRGARFNNAKKEVNMERPRAGIVGIDSLGLLNFMHDAGYDVILPVVEYSPKKGYKGLRRP